MLYEMTIENELTDGVYAISLVDKPAIQEDFVLLSKDDKLRIDIKLEKTIDKKKKIVCGAILIPDKVIPRQEYDIIFRADTIRKISENYIMNGNKDNVTLQHQLPVNKVYMVESWIVEDPEKDKSAALGMNLPVGTWCGSFKVNDEALWSEYLESGVLKGFSIEGSFTQKEVHLHEHQHLTEDELLLLSLYLELKYDATDADKYYKWELGKTDNNCPACLEFNGQIKKLSQWAATAIPSVPNGTMLGKTKLVTSYPVGPYSTYCENACNCRLVKVADIIKKIPIKSPISKWK